MKTEEEIEQLALLKYPKFSSDPYNPEQDDEYYERLIWIEGYTQCQEDMVDKKYTEEDMIAFAYQFSSINVADFRKHLKDFDVNLNDKNKQD